MKRGLTTVAVLLTFACGGGGSSPTSPTDQTTQTPTTATPASTPTPTPTPTGPKTSFGSGTYHVGTDIASGRYYTRAIGTGCYWERESGFGGTSGEIIANDFVGFAAPQIIVDIADSDLGFKTQTECGTWSQSPKAAPAAGAVTAGWWLVNSQIQPGRYSTTASENCYWERLSNFSGSVNGIIANDFESGAGQLIVQIGSSDIGFHSEPECGTWRPVSGSSSLSSFTMTQSRFEIEDNVRLRRAVHGG